MKTIKEAELLSWKAIWQAVEEGKHHFVQKAIDAHVARYPKDEQDEARLRTIHIVRHTQRQPAEVRQRIRRVSSTIRTLQKGCFNALAANQEQHHAT
ncbi:hypothetical protein [Marinobacter sp.]|uniref:hypothetical protein n=1 Tax=Marinobacter sp. TaxID=50741 RepID=UPI003A91ECC9